MSTISSTASASSAWSDMSAQRTKMREKLFSKADADGNGGVDASELQSMLARLSGNSGTDDSSSSGAAALLKKMDSDGNGSLSSTELDAGMRALMGPPPSTMQFAQSRSGDSGDSGDAFAIGSTGRSGDDLFSKIDANADGSVDAGELAAFKEKLTQAMDGSDPSASSSASDANGDGTLAKSELGTLKDDLKSAFDGALQAPQSGCSTLAFASSSTTSSSADDARDAAARLAQEFAKLMQGQYAQFANAASQPSVSAGLSLAA